VGLLPGTAVKIAIAFTMLGMFVAALLIWAAAIRVVRIPRCICGPAASSCGRSAGMTT
jgi:hypothetical protein